jgi:hypothetical protein
MLVLSLAFLLSRSPAAEQKLHKFSVTHSLLLTAFNFIHSFFFSSKQSQIRASLTSVHLPRYFNMAEDSRGDHAAKRERVANLKPARITQNNIENSSLLGITAHKVETLVNGISNYLQREK